MFALTTGSLALKQLRADAMPIGLQQQLTTALPCRRPLSDSISGLDQTIWFTDDVRHPPSVAALSERFVTVTDLTARAVC